MSAAAVASTISVMNTEMTFIVSVKLMGTTLDIYRVLIMYVKGGWKRMTREEIKDELYRMLSDVVNGGYPKRTDVQKARYKEAVKRAVDALDTLEKMNSSDEPNKWIPLTKRPMTEEEREEYEGIIILNGPLPEDGQEVLVSYGGYVCVDTYHDDDGCYFEGVEIDEVDAWQELPTPFKPQESEE